MAIFGDRKRKESKIQGMLVRLIINAIAFYVTARIVPGMDIAGWESLIVVAVLWGVLTMILKPILIILTLPINIMTLGLFTFVINGVLLMILGAIVPGFIVGGLGTAILASIVLSLVNMVLENLR